MTHSEAPPTITDRGYGLAVRGFGAVLWRDVVVARREIVPFLLQTLLQPLFTLFVFGNLLIGLGYVQGSYAAILLPGIVALNGFLGGLQNTALPLVLDFSWSREIEDRLLSAMPIGWVAAEKMLFGALRGMLSAVLMVPIGYVVLGIIWPVSALPAALGIIVLGSLVGAAIGMAIGTIVDARRINVLFGVILIPVMFTGCTQFPWPSLSGMRWFQVACAINPLTYVSEAMRAVLVPGVPSVPLWVDVPVLVAAVLAFAVIGGFGFQRRAVD